MPSIELPGCQFRIERLTADPRQEAEVSQGTCGKKLTKHIIVPDFFKSVSFGKVGLQRRRQWIPDHHRGRVAVLRAA
jgi:hypothetical protein